MEESKDLLAELLEAEYPLDKVNVMLKNEEKVYFDVLKKFLDNSSAETLSFLADLFANHINEDARSRFRFNVNQPINDDVISKVNISKINNDNIDALIYCLNTDYFSDTFYTADHSDNIIAHMRLEFHGLSYKNYPYLEKWDGKCLATAIDTILCLEDRGIDTKQFGKLDLPIFVYEYLDKVFKSPDDIIPEMLDVDILSDRYRIVLTKYFKTHNFDLNILRNMPRSVSEILARMNDAGYPIDDLITCDHQLLLQIIEVRSNNLDIDEQILRDFTNGNDWLSRDSFFTLLKTGKISKFEAKTMVTKSFLAKNANVVRILFEKYPEDAHKIFDYDLDEKQFNSVKTFREHNVNILNLIDNKSAEFLTDFDILMSHGYGYHKLMDLLKAGKFDELKALLDKCKKYKEYKKQDEWTQKYMYDEVSDEDFFR